MNPNALMLEQAHFVVGLSNTVPSSTTPVRVSLKGYERLTIVLLCLNATTVTGSAITVKQTTDVTNSQSDEKAVAFATMWANTDCAAGDTLTETTVTSNTGTTNSKSLMYVIEVRADDLDLANGFDCVRVGTGNATAQTVTALYVLWPQRFGKRA
jgi:hypothetical protein